jgi:NAD(P)-dependent dehydrogenase (short-subunit alcohol dehydrogenase family)
MTTNDAPARPSDAFVVIADAIGRSRAQARDTSSTAVDVGREVTRQEDAGHCDRQPGDYAIANRESARGRSLTKPLTDYTTEDFQLLVATNLAGFLYLTQLAMDRASPP